MPMVVSNISSFSSRILRSHPWPSTTFDGISYLWMNCVYHVFVLQYFCTHGEQLWSMRREQQNPCHFCLIFVKQVYFFYPWPMRLSCLRLRKTRCLCLDFFKKVLRSYFLSLQTINRQKPNELKFDEKRERLMELYVFLLISARHYCLC